MKSAIVEIQKWGDTEKVIVTYESKEECEKENKLFTRRM